MNSWKAAQLGFFDGYSACLLMFKRNISVPGSPSPKLIESTAPEMLRQYRAINPLLPDLLLKMKASALARDRAYARMLRAAGCVEVAAIVGAIWLLAVHKRF